MNDEVKMSNAEGMTKRMIRYIGKSLHRTGGSTVRRFNGLTRRSHSPFSSRAFTLVEMVVVFGLIIVLTGLVLSTVGYARKKGARARAETEIAAMSAACENYKADNSVYPYNPETNTLDARTNLDPSVAVYQAASLFLYKQLSGDLNANRQPTAKSYFVFKPNMLFPADQNQNVQYIHDPFGNSYGYSTAANPQANPTPTGTPGYNPTFDLWSTTGVAPSPTPAPPVTQQDLWIKNW